MLFLCLQCLEECWHVYVVEPVSKSMQTFVSSREKASRAYSYTK